LREFTDRRRDGAGHDSFPFRTLENRLLRDSTEGNGGDSVVVGVAAHTVPAIAAVLAFPRVENANERLVEV
ncbi:hypothetical protein N665_4261s0001, partial [Sinapis alba]